MKIYLMTQKQMQVITDHICQLSKELELPRHRSKCSEVNNQIAQLQCIDFDAERLMKGGGK